MSNVYKKPSTLCLPVACQPDPAVYPRIPRKLPEDSAYTSQQFAIAQQTQSRPMLRRHSVPAGITNTFTNTQQMSNYPRALQVTQYEVDAALARYETILGDSSYEAQHITKVTSCSNKSSVNNSKSSKNKIISHMKPKVPFSIKQKQEQSQKIEESAITTREKQKHRPNSPCNVERLELEEITTEVLDNMLSELLKSGCENRINEKNLTENTSDAQDTLKFETGEKDVVERPPSGTSKAESSQCSKSFNYQDISQNMSKSKHNLSKLQTNDDTSKSLTNSQTSSPVNSPRFGPTSISNVIEQTYPKSTSYICVDQNSAIELHRSKSYIVGLIDRALSKELGTIPERPKSATASHCSSRKNEQMNARQAINLINKNCNNMDKGLCLEITQALAESIVSHSAPTHHKTEDKHSSCSCNVQDEPLYVKQLKQLRWGHLKHIQREVKRLEDLERFLDSCSSGSANN